MSLCWVSLCGVIMLIALFSVLLRRLSCCLLSLTSALKSAECWSTASCSAECFTMLVSWALLSQMSLCWGSGTTNIAYYVYHSSSGGGLVPPLPWEIEEDAVQPFKDEVRLIEVPHTESTKTCHRCRGTGIYVTA